MTIEQARREFIFLLDKLGTGVIAEMDNDRIDLALDIAQESFIKMRYRPVRELIYRNVGFEEIQKRIEDLTAIVDTAEVALSGDSVDSDVVEVDTESISTSKPYMFYLRSRVNVDDKWVRGNVTIHSKLEEARLDPFNKSWTGEVLVYFENNKIKVVKPPLASVDKIRVTYLYKPEDISSSGEFVLSDHTAREIVRYSVDSQLEVLESNRAASHKQEILKVE